MQITHDAIGGRAGGSQIGAWVSELGARLVGFVSRVAERRRAATALYRCTDRELRDMGLNRGDLPAIINGTYRWPAGF